MKGGEWKDEQFLFEALNFQISIFPWSMKDSKLSREVETNGLEASSSFFFSTSGKNVS